MKTCNDCKNKSSCVHPCEWLEAQLRRVEKEQTEITFTELKKDPI